MAKRHSIPRDADFYSGQIVSRLRRVELLQWLSGLDSYASALFTLIHKADPKHKKLLRSIYSNHVKAYEDWLRDSSEHYKVH